MTYPSPNAKPLYRGTQIVWYVASIIEIILFFRFILRLIGANQNAPFTDFIYDLSAPIFAPFQRMVASTPAGTGVFDWNVLIAMLVYWVLATIIVRLILMGKPVSSYEAHRGLEAENRDTPLL